MSRRPPDSSERLIAKPTIELAEQLGELARKRGRARVTPFYQEFVQRNGRKTDITDELNKAWLKGYDLDLNRDPKVDPPKG